MHASAHATHVLLRQFSHNASAIRGSEIQYFCVDHFWFGIVHSSIASMAVRRNSVRAAKYSKCIFKYYFPSARIICLCRRNRASTRCAHPLTHVTHQVVALFCELLTQFPAHTFSSPFAFVASVFCLPHWRHEGRLF